LALVPYLPPAPISARCAEARPCPMRAPSVLRLLLAAALARAAWAQDEVSLLQQSVGSLSGQGEVVAYEVGENVQVKFEGEKRWVDCSIEARGSLPNSYTIHVPSMSDGLIEDKTFNDVPWNMLRRVYKGFDINIDQGPNSSAWAACMLLEQQGKNYKVELLEMRPGMVLENVPGELLREGEERTQKVVRLKEMLKENEAKRDLWYIAEVKQHSSKLEEQVKKQQKDEEERTKLGMKLYVWKEMAERARKEEEAEAERKRKMESSQASRAKEFTRVRKAKLETKMDALEQSAESDPVAALMLKAQQVSKEVRDREEQMERKVQEKAEEEKKMKELEKKLAEQRRREVEEHQAMLKRERQALRMKVANGTAVEVSPLAKKMEQQAQAVAAMELDQRRHKALIVSELESMKQEEDKKYKEEEIRRKDSVRERREAGAQTHLRRARRVYEEDGSKNKQAGVSALLSALTDAAGAGLEDEEVDAARVIVTQRLTTSAREILQQVGKNGSLAEVERALKSLPGKAAEVERIWSSIQDPESKWHTPHFEEPELAELREQLPELRMREVKFEALRQAIKLAKVNKNLLKKAINAAEKGGLPGEEIEEARGRLQFRETKPDYTKPIQQAIKASDPDALAVAVARAEGWGQLDGGFMHHARHVLHELQERAPPSKKEQRQEAEKPKVQALSSLAP